jgi:hypothetical protein
MPTIDGAISGEPGEVRLSDFNFFQRVMHILRKTYMYQGPLY